MDTNKRLPNVERIVCSYEVGFVAADDVRLSVIAVCVVSFDDSLEMVLADVGTSVMKERIVNFDECLAFVVDAAESSITVV